MSNENEKNTETTYQVIFDTTGIGNGSAEALRKFLKTYGFENLTIREHGNIPIVFLTEKHLKMLQQHYDLILKIVSITTDLAACATYNQFFSDEALKETAV